MVRRCWVNFQCHGVLLTWLTVGQGPIVLSVGAGGGCFDSYSLICHFSFLSPSPSWETARYRLKYCLNGPLSPKQPTNQILQNLPKKYSPFTRWSQDYNSLVTSLHKEASDWLRYALIYLGRSIFCSIVFEREDFLTEFMVLDFI